MDWSTWSADKAADVQAVTAIAQAVLTCVALAIAIGVPAWQQWKERSSKAQRRDEEIAGLRLALHTEVGVVANQCILEHESWAKISSSVVYKNVRTARLPRLVVFEANAHRLGLLGRDEIVSLIGFAGALHDISVAVDDVGSRGEKQTAEDRRRVLMLLSNACGNARKFLAAVPGIADSDQDQGFIKVLGAAYDFMAAEREKGRRVNQR